MPKPSDHSQPAGEPGIPPALVEALGGLYRLPVDVPPAVDAAILREAKAGYARRRRFWLVARRVGAAAAVGAAALIVLVLYLDWNRSTSSPVAATGRAVSGDVDGSGRVDILDAFVLARKVDGKAPSGAGEDVNGDGVLDRRDVDQVAGMAVAVGAPETRGRS